METVKGFKDFTGEEAIKRAKIRAIITRYFRLYGFEPAETPLIEQESFVRGENQNDEAVSDIFKLNDKGKRKLALRYEFTFQLKRISKNKKLPYKRYSIGEVFRDEPISANRFRQFTQCDADIVGSSVKEEAEILSLASKVFDELGIKNEILFNNKKLLKEILDSEKINESDREQVMRELDKLDKLPEEEVKFNLNKFNAEGLIEIFKKPEAFFKKFKAYEEIQKLKEYCSFYGVKPKFVPSLVRGLSYYTGSIFEIKTKEMKETISAGGSYLVNGLQSTGIAFGLDRLAILSKLEMKNKDILIISIGQEEKAIKLAEKLREEKKQVIVMYDKVSKALDYANSNKMPYVVFVGEEEVKTKMFKLKDMDTGKEKLVSESELLDL
jgi:histidyl-tRNA synthetase